MIAVAATGPAADDATWAGWLTAAELAYAAGRGRAVEHLTARLLAKQATLRLLGFTDRPPWRSLELTRSDGQPPRLAVHGELARWCAERGLAPPGVSMSHAGGYAAALAWAPAGAR